MVTNLTKPLLKGWLLALVIAASAGARVETSWGQLTLVRKGAWPGYPRANPVAVTLHNHFAYVAGQSALVVYDLTVPTNPVPVGGVKGDISYVADSYARSNRLYVAGGLSGLHIFDITKPAELVQIGWYRQASSESSARATQVVGRYAYVANDLAGVTVVDVADPTNPQRVGNYDTTGRAQGIHIVGDYAYVADEAAGLVVLGISNPTNPVPIGTYNTPGYASRVFVAGHHAFVCDGFSGLQIVNVSNPTNPVFSGVYSPGDYISAVRVVDDIGYVTAGDSVGMVLLNITDPSSPVEISRTGFLIDSPSDLKVEDNYVYVANYGSGPLQTPRYQLHVIDASIPTSPRRVGGHRELGGHARKVHVSGTTAYVTDGAIVPILDLSNLSAPVVSSVYTSSFVNAVQAVGERLFTAGSSGLEVIDVSNRFAPNRIVARGSFAHDVKVVGNLAFVATRSESLTVYDCSNPANPLRIDDHEGEGEAISVSVSGSLGAILAPGSGLSIVDLTDPTEADQMAVVPFYNSAGEVTLVGDRAYFAPGPTLLRIADLQNPSTPIELGTYALTNGGTLLGLRVVGNRAYLACGTVGVIVLDVSNPARPVQIGSYKTPGPALGLHVEEPFIFIAQGNFGLLILEANLPQLSIRRTNNSVILSWPPGNAAMLEETDNPTGNWTNASSGSNNPVILPAEHGKSFYRLRAL